MIRQQLRQRRLTIKMENEKQKMTAIGVVKALRKDRKGLQLADDQWYANKFGKEIEANIGDEVKITYVLNGQWKNHETVEVLKKKENSLPSYVKETSDSRDRSMAVSYAKDLVVALINKSKDISEAEKQMEKLAETANGIYALMGSLPLHKAEFKQAEMPKAEIKVEKIELK